MSYSSAWLEIRILGPLTLSYDNRQLGPTARKPRSLLALLLLHANQPVPAAKLLQEMWGAEPPASALPTLQTYVLHLRKLFSAGLGIPAAEVARNVLVTGPGGYTFRAVPEHFDLFRYEHLTAEGRRALAEGRNELAADLLQQARNQWRGPALADVRPGPLVRPHINRLEESRLTTTEQSIEARLRLGRHQEVLPELAGMLAEHRLHENLHAQFMVALHRSGRRQDALRVFKELRTAMAEELGLEPSKRLQQLQRAILADDPALEVVPRADGLAQLLDHLRVA
jgi:SARP family transcriptional regulator, regulator of embCAB operon